MTTGARIDSLNTDCLSEQSNGGRQPEYTLPQ